MDLVGAALTAPFSSRTRRVLWRLFRLAARPTSRIDGTEAHFIAVELAAVAQLDDDDPEPGCLGLGLQFPFLVASIAFMMARLILGGFFVTPLMAALWRRRRLLADATAVELTRDPNALVTALEHLEEHGATVPAGPWTHLFMVGPEIVQGRARRRLEQRRNEVWNGDRLPGESRAAALQRRTRATFAASAEYQSEVAEPTGSTDDGSADLAGFLPTIPKRLERLEAMGAQLDARHDPPPPRSTLLTAVIWVTVPVLVAVLAVLLLMLVGCVLAMIYLALIFEMFLLAPPVVIVHALLR
jgi:hypothetical protein